MSASRSTCRPRMRPSASAASLMCWIWPRPWCTVRLPSERDSVHLTGLPSLRVSSRQSTSSAVTCSLVPNPPPTSGAITRSLCSGMPVVSASITRSTCGICVDDHSVKESPSVVATTARGSIAAPISRCCTYVRSMTTGASLEGGVDVTGGDLHGVRLVALLVHLRAALGQRLGQVDHRGQRLVVDLDRLQRVGGQVAVRGDHAGHRLAHVPDLRHRHRRVVRDARCPPSPARRTAGCPARRRSPGRRTRRPPPAGRAPPTRPPG